VYVCMCVCVCVGVGERKLITLLANSQKLLPGRTEVDAFSAAALPCLTESEFWVPLGDRSLLQQHASSLPDVHGDNVWL
jgi:hypothetical protein